MLEEKSYKEKNHNEDLGENEVQSFLNELNNTGNNANFSLTIDQFLKKVIDPENKGISLDEERSDDEEIKENIQQASSLPLDAKVNITISADALMAKLSLSPPMNGGQEVTEEILNKALKERNIVHGIKTDFVSRIARVPIYNMSFKIAEGVAARKGDNGKLVLMFDDDNKGTPFIDEKGNADFKTLNKITNVQKDQLLCEIIPPTEGKDGINIYGKVLPGKDGVAVPNPLGTNTYLSEDKTKIYAACDGNVFIKDDKVCVGQTMTVESIDNSTGNVIFNGTVVVKGDIRSGFTVRASNDIVVNGVVEEATLIAGRNIIMSKGVNGKKSQISADGNIKSTFIENANVKAGGDISAYAILHSNIDCEGEVVLLGEKACIIGGVCKVGKNIRAKSIGNKSNVQTKIIITGANKLYTEKYALDEKLSELLKTKEKLDTILEALSQNKEKQDAKTKQLAIKTLISKKNIDIQISNTKKDITELELQIKAIIPGRVYVRAELHNNVLIDIDGVLFKNEVLKFNCVVYKNGKNIAFSNQ